MSLNLDANFPHSERGSTNKIESSDRRVSKFAGKTKTLRLDSPTTIQACRELGILVEDLKPKVIEDFKDPNVEEEVVQLRFNYYFKRYNQFVIDVMARKKELTRANQRLEKMRQKQEAENPRSMAQIVNSSRLNNSTSPNVHKHRTSTLNATNPLMMSYNKTVAYLRTSHDVAGTRDIRDILGTDAGVYGDDGTDRFDSALAQEVTKFNKLKRQKQKEAMDTFLDEMKRVKIVEDMKAKEKRQQEREKKLAVEKKKEDEERKRKAEDKLEKIREAEKQFRAHKLEEKEKIKKKLDEVKKKLTEEAEERKKNMADQEEKLERKRRIAEERREQLKQEEQARCDQLKLELEAKLNQSKEKHYLTLNDKSSKVKLQINKIEESVKKIKEKQEQDTEENVQGLIHKLVKKEESIRAFQHKQMVEAKKREQELTEKNKRFIEHKSDLNQQYKDKMKELNERFQKAQENLEAKKQQDEKNMRLKQEENNLRILDKQEAYNRKLRQTQYERQKVLDKAKNNEEKIQWLKAQRGVLQQAKVEVSIQSKIEKDRIEQSLQHLSKLINENSSTENMTDQQRRILKDILTPEDWKRLQDEEKRREDAKKEAEEAKKLGLPVPVAVKAR